ncbi:mannitol dehydrogenase family protein [Aureimonas sp. Leaf324]|jgi:mannitol 2-dehydrogenase|uniref:mannitol dehydrogenase family protein n=1 Tax=Aureimonas sp. Leaf324 TaxID=1736336 RepID=UPI0006FFD007|nr:mannitol dehydrogenase family protein [Aureimonas sp. Leaf324]KQQ79436.1 mannitol dehydrogenase [Aureimonas sp. Leaf324]
MVALGNGNLAEISKTADVPAYDRGALTPGIAHFGVGNFHRAHQCVYLDDLFATGAGHDFAVVGLGVRPEEKAAFADLTAQDGLYTVTEVDEGVRRTRVIGSVVRLVEPGDRAATMAVLTDPAIRIVTLTITEGGYYLSGDKPNLDHPDLAADAADLSASRTVFGLIVAALAERQKAGTAPFTVLCCDNLPHNGDLTRKLVTGLASKADAALADHIETAVAFPNSMVDRITPATTPAQAQSLREETGIEDKRPVFCEPFIQWVVEENFCNGRPALETVGVTFVEDVTPYELMKLRILNAGHATIAYPAALLGLTYAHDAMRDDLVLRFFRDVEENELLPTAPGIEGVSREDYLATVTSRFANPAIADTLRRLALDGSNRQPKFILPSVRERLARGEDISGLALVGALWCRYCYGTLEDGTAIEPNDPNWDALQAAARTAKDEPRRFLEQRDIFGDLAENPVYAGAFSGHLKALWRDGVRPVLEGYLAHRAG